LPLVGRWQGAGAVANDGAQFRFEQQVTFAHDGRPFLAYTSRSRLVDDDGQVIRSAWRETGFWRPGASEDDLEIVLASNTGEAMVFAGASGDLRWEVSSTAVVPAATAKEVDGERRLYALVDEQLRYVTELAVGGRGFAPHLNAVLDRMPSERG
jgi:hypothetical protein